MTKTTNIQQDTLSVPKGYKKTSLGIIPKEWEIKRIDEFAPLQRGFDLPVDKIIEGKFPVVFSNGILNFHNEFKAKAPGVVTGRSGTIGKVTFVEEDYWPHNTALWVTDFKGNNPKYVYYFYSNFNLIRFGSGSGVPTLNRNDVHLQKIALPPLPEQQKIAEILSTWDTAIEKQNALIEQLELRKRGLMQQLLTGKLRLRNAEGEGFKGEWKKVRLEEVLEERVELTTKNNEVELLTSSRRGIFKQSDYFDKQVASQNNIGYKKMNKFDFTYRAMTDDDVFRFNQLTDLEIGAVSPAYSVFYSPKVPSILIKEILNSKRFGFDILKVAQGGTRKTLKFSELKKLKIKIPKFNEEQTAIAEVLSTADREIEIEKQKLAALQNQKKGLMQVLLSGRVRVKI